MENACYTAALPFVYDSPGEARDTIREAAEAGRHCVKEVSESARHTVAEVSRGNQFNCTDRANQDRYLAGEFRNVLAGQCSSDRFVADGFREAQKDRTDAAEWANERARDLTDRVRNAELATEKTGAATILAIEKTGAAAALAAAMNTAAIQASIKDCCCELQMTIKDEAGRTRDLVSQIDRERLQARLAVFEARAACVSV